MKITDEKPLFLAIESSCDDSSVAIIDARNYECVFYQTITQLQHSQAGGVVPELASRLHTATLPDILKACRPFFSKLCAVGATCEPGLSVSLQSGVACAKALCASLNVPFVAINHLKGHICSLFLESQAPKSFLCLLVSGGHTQLISVENGALKVLANTGDDSLGESFDKSAKMLAGPYPGGAWLSAKSQEYEALITNCASQAQFLDSLNLSQPLREFFDFSFSVPLLGRKDRLEFSFSGLKNQVRLKAQQLEIFTDRSLKELAICKISYEFELAAIAHIIDKLKHFVGDYEALGVVGGASANMRLRSRLKALLKGQKPLLLAPLEYCCDNARMIARAGIYPLMREEFSPLNEAIISPKSTEFTRL